MALAAGSTLGHYEVQGLIGKGGMGEVYRGYDTKLQRDVRWFELSQIDLKFPTSPQLQRRIRAAINPFGYRARLQCELGYGTKAKHCSDSENNCDA